MQKSEGIVAVAAQNRTNLFGFVTVVNMPVAFSWISAAAYRAGVALLGKYRIPLPARDSVLVKNYGLRPRFSVGRVSHISDVAPHRCSPQLLSLARDCHTCSHKFGLSHLVDGLSVVRARIRPQSLVDLWV